MKHRKAFVKEERQTQIINKYAALNKNDWSICITASEVGRWLDISPTQARTLLNGLVKQEILYMKHDHIPACVGIETCTSLQPSMYTACYDKRFPRRTKTQALYQNQRTADGSGGLEMISANGARPNRYETTRLGGARQTRQKF